MPNETPDGTENKKIEANDLAHKIKTVEEAIKESQKVIDQLQEEKTLYEQLAIGFIQTKQEERMEELTTHLARLDKTIKGFKSRLSILQDKRLELINLRGMHQFGDVLDTAHGAKPPPQILLNKLKPRKYDEEWKKIHQEESAPIDESAKLAIKKSLMTKATTEASRANASQSRSDNYIDRTSIMVPEQKPTQFNNPLLYAETNINSTMMPGISANTSHRSPNPLMVSCLNEVKGKGKNLDTKLKRLLDN